MWVAGLPVEDNVLDNSESEKTSWKFCASKNIGTIGSLLLHANYSNFIHDNYEIVDNCAWSTVLSKKKHFDLCLYYEQLVVFCPNSFF